MTPDSDEEFYVGYLKQAPPKMAAANRSRIIACALIVLAVAGALATLQSRFGNGSWDWTEQTFTGFLETEPAPSLVVLEKAGDQSSARRYLLVAPFKHGADALIEGHGGLVSLKGTRIEREGTVMIEMLPGTIAPATGPVPNREGVKRLGRHRFIGEIVDSKCFLGVMNPGHLKTHRACAVRCISGGIPPVLLVRDQAGQAVYLLLKGPQGEAINQDVLEFVAEPVQIAGEVEQVDDLLVLKADPARIQRLE